MKRLIIGMICCLVVVGEAKSNQNHLKYHDYRAVAVIQPTVGNHVHGVFVFIQKENGVMVSAVIRGLKPNAKHGMHIHQYGDITDKKRGLTVGGHYNPDGFPHGLPPSLMRHAGAFGNIKANERGEALFDFVDHTISISGEKNPIVGRAVVIHAKEDTGEQPAGNAGPRIGFGVIGLAR